jgi:hypothetical protein
MADFPAIIELDLLDGSDGFRLDGIDPGDYSGFSVASAGDVNGDGFDDVIVGAFIANAFTGQTYVVFGQDGGFPADLDLAALDGSNGFRLDGINDGDFSGFSVASAGDFNDDGFADVIIGAWNAAADGNDYSGESYVVFGHGGSFDSSVDLAALDGSNGFRIDGIASYDYSGRSVASAGDVNGDGFDDLIIGAYGAAGGDPYAGETYVVFGHGGATPASFDLAALDGSNGFRLDGIAAGDASGYSVSSAGDVNGDGFADVIIGAYAAAGGGSSYAGESYVVFGRASGFDAIIDLGSLDGSDGFRLDGATEGDYSGFAVASAGDVNGDGFDDMVVGAWRAGEDAYGPTYAGETYVVFGHAGAFSAAIDLDSLDGTDGFRLDGAELSGNSGFSVASAGDVNGDGFDDLVIGGPGCGCGAGSGFVVFGHDGPFAASLSLALLDGDNGFIMQGIDDGDRTANSVASAGDVNGDGFADIILGAPGADAGGAALVAGESYVVFGREPTAGVTRIGASANQTILGGIFDDTLRGVRGDDRLDGRYGDDALFGGVGDDQLSGGSGKDWLVGGRGVDSMTGGDGDDSYQIMDAGDLAIENSGEGRDRAIAHVDYVLGDNVEVLRLVGAARSGTGNGLANEIFGSGGDDTLFGLGGDDLLRGVDGDDTIEGGDGADWISGGLGTDALLGGAGDDRLSGGEGADTLTGGGGRDVFAFRDGDSAATWAEADIVSDFDQGAAETLRLDAIDADTVAGGNQAFSWLGAGAFTGVAGQLHYVQSAGNTFIEGDTDGDGDADFVIRLDGLHGLVAGDFVL